MNIEAEHYGVNVADIDRSIEFYRDVLGFELAEQFSADGEKQGELIGVPQATGELAFIDTGTFQIELIEYDTPPNDRIYDSVDMHDIGITHLCFEVENVDSWHKKLKDDVEFETNPLILEGGVKIAYFYDPDGNQLELLETDVNQ
ncbi:hypothetical protein EL22_26610 [Halostagnicola sp. A56]|uniref:VOC family protein n=1 Tax=Halostagnicola sp. A56 TaxID=1495067 RepID=UPI00065F6B83|nr:VOC family protein [Halostagnicola sp. A56]KMT45892.1 hypothetical protein EL22_26610 [Halostagnicola sp. A56]